MNDKTHGAWRAAFGVAAVGALGAAAWWLAIARVQAAPAADLPGPVLEHHGRQVWLGEDSPLRYGVKVQALALRPIEAPFDLPATVEADPARLAKVVPPVTGRIASLDKHLGDLVRPGEVLFRIDAPDVSQAQADAQKARAALALASQARARQQALGAVDIAAGRDVEQAQDDYDQARSELARAEAKLAQWGATRAADGHVLSVRAPIAGRVVDLNAAPGGYWNDAAAALMTVADLSSVYVVASAAEQDVRAIHPGQAVRVTLDAYPGENMNAKVDDIAVLLDPDTRRVKVRMRVDNRDGRLKPGMYARASFVAPPRIGLLVPARALVQSGFETRVYLEVSPWHYEPRVVRTGPRIGDAVEILAGLEPGARVVVEDAVLLND